MQPDRFPDLLQDKFPIALMLGSRQALGSARKFNRVGILDTDALEEFSKSEFKTVVEAPEDGGIAVVFLTRSVEVEYLFQRGAYD